MVLRCEQLQAPNQTVLSGPMKTTGPFQGHTFTKEITKAEPVSTSVLFSTNYLLSKFEKNTKTICFIFQKLFTIKISEKYQIEINPTFRILAGMPSVKSKFNYLRENKNKTKTQFIIIRLCITTVKPFPKSTRSELL